MTKDVGIPENSALIHPGEILLTEFMEPLGLTAYRLAKDLAVAGGAGPNGVITQIWVPQVRIFGPGRVPPCSRRQPVQSDSISTVPSIPDK